MARQLGLITRAQALESGLTRRQIDGHVARGRWLLAGEGVYASATHPRSSEQRALALALSAGGDARLSFATAAAILTVPGGSIEPIHVTVPWEHRWRSDDAIVHRTRSLTGPDRTTYRRFPITTPSRTLIDLAAVWPAERVEDAIDDVLCRGMLSAGHLGRRATALAGRGRSGPRQMLDLLAVWSQDEKRSTQRELRVCRDIVAAGLPMPERQVPVRDRTGKIVASVDGGYEALKRGFEFNSFRWHATRRAFYRDQQRTALAIELGWTLYPVVEVDLRSHCARLCRWLQSCPDLAALAA
jgi:hypothetical protein